MSTRTEFTLQCQLFRRHLRVRSIDRTPDYFVFMEIHIEIVKHLLKYYFKHIFIILNDEMIYMKWIISELRI